MMSKSAQKRNKQKTNETRKDNKNKKQIASSTEVSSASVQLKYVILIGLLSAIAGSVLFSYFGKHLPISQREVHDEINEINGQEEIQRSSQSLPHKDSSQVNGAGIGDVLIEEEETVDPQDQSQNVKREKVTGSERTYEKDLGSDEGTASDNGKATVDLKENVDQKLAFSKEKDSKKQSKHLNKKVAKKEKNNLPKEIRDFKPTFQKQFTPKKIFADGRRLPPIELLPQKPNNSSVRVYMYEEFLSEAECDGLRKAHDRHVTEVSKQDPIVCFDSITTLRKHLKAAKKSKVKVTVNDFTEGTTCLNASLSSQFKMWIKSNWSLSTSFYPGESKFSSIYEQRAKAATGLVPENGGKFQITSYPLGIGYNSHTDCIVGSADKRDRFATMLVYLDTVEKGGETAFPELGIWVRPKKGRALVWNNMNSDGECEPLSVHTAAKVEIGNKYILQRWFYYKSFYSLGKRPQEPRLPVREQLQPKVHCDEYEHGSCRWYDEWGYNHLLDYERQKLTLI